MLPSVACLARLYLAVRRRYSCGALLRALYSFAVHVSYCTFKSCNTHTELFLLNRLTQAYNTLLHVACVSRLRLAVGNVQLCCIYYVSYYGFKSGHTNTHIAVFIIYYSYLFVGF